MRLCACGCRALVTGRATRVYASPRCKQRVYRRRVRAAMRAAGLPSSASLQTARTLGSTTGSNGDGKTATTPRQRRRTDLRVSYRKAVAETRDTLRAYGISDAEQVAASILQRALSDRQREQLNTNKREEQHATAS